MYGLALGLAAALLFGASTPASKALLEAFTPTQLAGLLYLGAALATAPVVALERRTRQPLRLGRGNLLCLVGAVVFGGVLGPVLLLFGLKLTLAGSVSLLLNLEMGATAVLGVLLFHEPLGRSGWLGAAGIVAAGAVLAGSGGWPGLWAGLLVASACLCWGLDNHFTALIDGITPARSTLVKGLVAGTTNFTIGALASPLGGSGALWAAALAIGALSYGASIVLYIASAQQLGATRAQGVFASAPFAGALLSVFWLGEPLGGAHALAALLLVASVTLLLRSAHEHTHVHAPVEHIHSHRHDDGHHLHTHPDGTAAVRHTHAHRHTRLVHAHPHWPDLHHRHSHDGGAD